jgi:indoleamine 2,3-dioxygenase
MEACGAKMIRLVLDSITTISMTTTDDNDGTTTEATSNRNIILTNILNEMEECIDELGHILERMYERNDPMIFYHQIRPLLAGSKNMGAAGLPNGVFYDTGDEQAKWHQYSGGSNAQSSLVQLIDIALGIQHIASGEVEGKTSKDKHTAFMKVTSPLAPFHPILHFLIKV